MKKSVACLAVAILCTTCSAALAISFGGPGGKWPASWPQQLEPLRKQAWTWEHGFGGISYDIPFDDREQFESVWPTILKLKSEGAPIILMRGRHVRVDPAQSAGVRIMLPPELSAAAKARRSAATSTPPEEPPSANRGTAAKPDHRAGPAAETDRAPAKPSPPATLGESIPAGRLPDVSIMLIVDGEIVDLNRIRLPADTPIIDRRFED